MQGLLIAQDGDTLMWKRLANETERMVTVHMGDQIYADVLERQPIIGSNHAQQYEYAYKRYREFYRKSWSNVDISLALRSSSNLMIPGNSCIRKHVEFQ